MEDQKDELQRLLASLPGAEAGASPSGGLQIIFNAPVVFGSDLGTIHAFKLILAAYSRSTHDDKPALTRAKVV